MDAPAHLKRSSLAALTLGAVGVVYGDIGTSPLYAFREALSQAMEGGITRWDILGVLSLALWALVIVVTLKYVFFLSRMDNNGEGGVLSLMALVKHATQGRWRGVLVLGAIGAALFYGDAIITPALSVLSAVEGLKTIPGLEAMNQPTILGLTVAVLVGLFALQSRGTASVAVLFGPVCLVWFAVLAVLGGWYILQTPQILAAFNPYYAVLFLMTHGLTGLFVLGAVFLTVTGAEALIADMGHFGRQPIQLGWLGLVWPALTLNYLGQGAIALQALDIAQDAGEAFVNADWFFLMAPQSVRAVLVLLATLATIIASQAVITGAYSLTHQAIALGLLPRQTIRQTSAQQVGQIYMPGINWLLLAGVIVLVFGFRGSSAMAAAYGIAVTGTMVVTTCLAFIIAWKGWGWHPAWAGVLILPFLALDVFFFGANILRVTEGGWVPLVVAAMVGIVILTWVKGCRAVGMRTSQQGVPMVEMASALTARPPVEVEGTAIFLTQDPDVAPSALLHNLKHNKTLHRRNIVLKIEILNTPWTRPQDRLQIEPIRGPFYKARLSYGYMDKIDVPSDLARQDDAFLALPGGTSFFVGRNAVRLARRSTLPRWVSAVYMFLHRNAADPTAYFNIPANRVVELGTQVTL